MPENFHRSCLVRDHPKRVGFTKSLLRGGSALRVQAADAVADEFLDLELQLAALYQLVRAHPLPLCIRLRAF